MADNSRIPRSMEGFNTYIINTNNHLLAGEPTTNAERLGILPTEMTQWTSFATDWSPLYSRYSDKKNSRTSAVIDEMRLINEDCIAFDQDNRILDRIASSPNVTVSDLSLFNIKRGLMQKSTRSVSTTPISEPVMAAMQPIGGGSFAIKCRSASGSRASIIAGADCVQFVYSVGDTPPTSAESTGLSKDISSKASFTLALGAANSAKYLYIYFRWYNTKHPELAGTWSAMQTSLIL